MKSLYLIGFMGSGKSIVGFELSKLLDVIGSDTDHMIEEENDVKIADIFRSEGERAFRKYESETLQRIPVHNHIVSTGGGIVETEENIAFMKANGTVVFLETSLDEIETRLHNDRSRPLWDKNSFEKQQLFDRRSPLYKNCADIIVQTDDRKSQDIAAEVKTQLGLKP